ncbi:unnamed protein product, partial [Mesorhabditis spiculigera]
MEVEPPREDIEKKKRRSLRGRRSSIMMTAVEDQATLEVTITGKAMDTTDEWFLKTKKTAEYIKNYAKEVDHENENWEGHLFHVENQLQNDKRMIQEQTPLGEDGCDDNRSERAARNELLKILTLMRSRDDSGVLTQRARRLEVEAAKLKEETEQQREKINALQELLAKQSSSSIESEIDYWKKLSVWAKRKEKELHELSEMLFVE